MLILLVLGVFAGSGMVCSYLDGSHMFRWISRETKLLDCGLITIFRGPFSWQLEKDPFNWKARQRFHTSGLMEMAWSKQFRQRLERA